MAYTVVSNIIYIQNDPSLFYGFLQTPSTYFLSLRKPEYDLTLGKFSTVALRQELKRSGKRIMKKTEDEVEYELTVKLVKYLLKHATLKEDPVKRNWRVYIIDSKEVNAFCCADGSIFVYRGLLDYVQTFDELALILAHEISHVLLRHVPSQLSTTGFFIGLLLPPLLVLDSDILANLGALLVNMFLSKPMSRFCEAEADSYGVKIMKNAQFDAREGSEFFSRIQATSAIMALFSTHPSDESRVNNIKQLANENRVYDEDREMRNQKSQMESIFSQMKQEQGQKRKKSS